MKPDDFEERLRRQPLRELPVQWRQEILSSAIRAASPPRATRSQALRAQLYALLWPCPQAWAGLAAIWLGLLVVNFTISAKTEIVAQHKVPASTQMMVLREQQQILTELIEPNETPAISRPKRPDARPRSQGRQQFLMA